MDGSTNETPLISRRRLIQLGGLGALGLPLLLEACGTAAAPASSPAASSAGASSAATSPSGSGAPAASAGSAAPKTQPFPTYAAIQGGPKPDYHSSDPRITDGFDNYPANPAKFMTGSAPGTGARMDVFIANLYPPPTPYDQNPTWKAINKQLNENVQMNMVAAADFNTRLATVMAGGNLPDTLFMIGGVGGAPGFGSGFPVQFLETQCSDLTPYLAGSAAKDYPNLAAIPTYSWRTSVAAGKLYSIPIHRYLPTFWFFVNSDVWNKEVGATTVPKDAADFKKILQQLNQPKANRWAIGNYVAPGSYGLEGYAEMFGAPNNWRLESSGKLTKNYETEEYKAAVGYLRDIMSSGLMPPDVNTGKNSRDDFIAGKFVVSLEAFGNGFNDFWRRGLLQKPATHFSMITPFASTAGGKPVHYLSAGLIAVNVLKKAAPDRIKEILRVINWLAVPFGTQEDVLLSYGLSGSDYKLDAKGNPIPTKVGLSQAAYVPWQYIGHHPYVWYQAGLPGYVKASFEYEQQLVKVGIDDPTIGFLSPTSSTKGVVANNTFTDGINDLLAGRRPLTDYDQLVKDWRSAAGDQIRTELQDAMAAAK
ncbi:MAG: hypothetical protein ACRDHX_03330 [Chloroflexota bacterium]